MHGTVPEKVGRVVGNLLTQPRYLPRYLHHNLGKEKTPIDLELPWFSYAAIDFLASYLQPHMKVCEYGAGGSTLFFAKEVLWVYSIENNPYWYQLVSERLAQKRIRNVELVLRPFDFKNPDGFQTSDYLWAMPDQSFDVIVIDTAEEWRPVRPLCFRHSEDRVKPGGIIVIDDSWRYPNLQENHRARHIETFKSVGPCRPGVTTTDIFFY